MGTLLGNSANDLLQKWAEEVQKKRADRETFELIKGTSDSLNIVQDKGYDKVKDLIRNHEGRHKYVTLDVDGYLVGGYGTKLDKDEQVYKEGDYVSVTQAGKWLDTKFDVSVKDSEQLFTNFTDFDEDRQAGLLELSYVLGLGKFKRNFNNLISEVNKDNIDWNQVANEFKYINSTNPKHRYYMKESKMYKQLGTRSPHIYDLLKGDKTIDEILLEYQHGANNGR